MKISDAAASAGLSVKAVRYYEQQGLIVSQRLSNGYRDYNDEAVDALKFVAHARELGFSVEACADLLELKKNPQRASASVKAVAEHRLKEIEKQKQRLEHMQDILQSLVSRCPGNMGPDCVIIETLEGKVEH